MTPRGTFRLIASDIRQRIQSGGLKPGSMVPSEQDLAEHYGVSRGTIRSALALLEDEDLVSVEPGRGRKILGAVGDQVSSLAYQKVADDLQRRIDNDEFAGAEPLPSEAELARAYHVSRNTVRRAYRQLSDRGVVAIRQGSGAFLNSGSCRTQE